MNVNAPGLSDADLFPLLDDTSAANLRRLREHPHAPRYNWRTGERLTPEGLSRVRAFARQLHDDAESVRWKFGELPGWLPAFLQICRRDVPFYRSRSPWSDDFAAIPLTHRDDIRQRPWGFVSDALPVNDELIVYTTSGTSGTALRLPATPDLPNLYLPLIERALAAVGVKLEGSGSGTRTISIIQVCAQRGTVILCSVASYLGGAGFAKINLDPADWNDANDAARFLDDCDPEIYTGDPFALGRLMELPLRNRPKALVSAGAALSDGLRSALIGRFGCPVIDLYSMNESGPIAFSVAGGTHQLFPQHLYVEILDDAGQPCPPGVRGQIVLTGGLNRYLPLVRYATGDFAALSPDATGGMPTLTHFEGRAPIVFQLANGHQFNSLDVSTKLAALPISFLSVHQQADRSLLVRAAGEGEIKQPIEQALLLLFGHDQPLDLKMLDPTELPTGKRLRFSCDL